ncbi:protein FAM8A1 [Arapaima gigas]
MADSGRKPESLGSNAVGNRTRTTVASGDGGPDSPAAESMTTTEYCRKLQGWMWQYYSGYVGWPSWTPPSSESSAVPLSPDARLFPLFVPAWPGAGAPVTDGGSGAAPAGSDSRAGQQQQQRRLDRNAQPAGREFSIPSPLQRFMAEMVDFFILFFIKATVILSIMHLSGMKDVSKFAMHFIVEEIDEDTSMEELQKMMLVALLYRILVCCYEIICIWGAGGATPGKFLLGLRVVTCDSAVLVRPYRVLVVPASNVKFSASTVRALNKNFSIALFFPAFITLLFFQHNRTVYDIVAGTIVVKRNGAR